MELQPCGTIAAYDRHCKSGETACAECKRAKAIYEHARRRGPKGLVPVGPTQRRLKALQSLGWTQKALAAEMGWKNGAQVNNILRYRSMISRRNAQLVGDLFDRLQCTAHPTTAHYAAWRKELPPPLAWDEETIDDPDAQPAEWRRPAQTLNRAEDIARDAAELMSYGETAEGAASRLGITLGSMQTAIRRAALRAERSA